MPSYMLNVYTRADFGGTGATALFDANAQNSGIREKTITFTRGAAPTVVRVNDNDPNFERPEPSTDHVPQTVVPGQGGGLFADNTRLEIVNVVHVHTPDGRKFEIYRIASNNDASTVTGIVMTDEAAAYLKSGGTFTVDSSGTIMSEDWAAGSVPYSSVCFSADVMIDIQRGPITAAMLKCGDMVRTRDDGYQPIRWVGTRDYDRSHFTPGNQPIRIRAGALGDNLPEADLVVSPQHRVLVRSKIAQKMFGTDEVLVAAKHLLRVDGIDVASDLDGVTYVHFMFDTHQIVFANGAEAESLFTGPEALKAVGPAARDEIFSIFPELLETADLPAARLITSGRMGRKLAERHMRNQKPLLM